MANIKILNYIIINLIFLKPTFFLNLIKWLDNYINETIRTLQDKFSLTTFVMFILVSFIYGIIHSAGPGHGKTIITTFFFKEKQPVIKAVTMASLVSIIHSGSSIILAVLFSTILTGIKGFFRIKLQSYFILASGILVTAIGMFFLLLKIFKKEKQKENSNKNIFMIGLSAGIVPCPVALIIMLFSISTNFILIGLASVISISLGMFFLLTVIGILSIKLRNGLLFLSGKYIKKAEIISVLVEYISISLIIIIGIFIVISVIF